MRGGQWSAGPAGEGAGKGEGREIREMETGERRDRGRGGEVKENGDRPGTIFGLEVALTMDRRTGRHVIVISNARLCSVQCHDN